MHETTIPMARSMRELTRAALADPLHPLWNDSSHDDSGIFGLPFDIEEASLVIVPVPWEVACSQGTGTANAPAWIVEASRYVELHDFALGNIYERGIALAPSPSGLDSLIRDAGRRRGHGREPDAALDSLCERMNERVGNNVAGYLNPGTRVGVIGGDHSISFGSIAAHQRAFPRIGILQIDAHADLRPSLDGMSWSHGSVMYNVMESLRPAHLTQVALRGVCGLERAYQSSNPCITVFTDHELQSWLAGGRSWSSICDRIVETLPAEIYLTLDIDGLDPACCPTTGTPVPGGLSYMQVIQLLHRVVESGRTLRGFDLVEVGGGAQDVLIAAHLLYVLCGLVEHPSTGSAAGSRVGVPALVSGR